MNSSIGGRLRELREQHGMTQADLAAKSGVHHTAISRYESGLDPGMRTFRALCAVFPELADAVKPDEARLVNPPT